ncbi:MAG: hypothetical protein EOM67_14235 [Spirochaetia bacterium]|nr:hypothetical protein [Spirochaetia bacterium]
MSTIENFEKSIFINCPYDENYTSALRLIIFTIMITGLNPRLASENSDCATVRLEIIKEIIHSCKYSIHDLSRMKAQKKLEYYRMNMPFELGLDFGCREFSNSNVYKTKKLLVLEGKKYGYQKALSDFAGIDIVSHNEETVDIIKSVRSWLIDNVPEIDALPGQKIIWDWYVADFSQFMRDQADISQQTEKEIWACSTSQLKKYVSKFLHSFDEAKKYRAFA